MQRHPDRISYYVKGEGFLQGLSPAGCPFSAATPAAPSGNPPDALFKFGRMFPRAECLNALAQQEMIDRLKELGQAMNAEPSAGADARDSDIPAGYTYLGQFIAHEITFDMTKGLPPVEDPDSGRSPQIDLDGIYGNGPDSDESTDWYEADRARLKVSNTTAIQDLNRSFPNDLFRVDKKAMIGDPRNDENLITAQTHLALISFHNRIVDDLKTAHEPAAQLFTSARKKVRQYFQWILLHDYLPRIVDQNVLDCVLRHGLRWFKAKSDKDLFMPLEFSGAVFRFGHSMVRNSYEWNYHHDSNVIGGKPTLKEFFHRTKFSGDLAGKPTLASDWVVDWRHFYDFTGLANHPPPTALNVAKRIDPVLDLHLNQIEGYPQEDMADDQKSIPVRNLLRGFALGLPTGEQVAGYIGETPLTPTEVSDGPYKALLSTPPLEGKTPLWFYVLREAELEALRNGNNRLGPVGSRIVAETLVGLIKYSPDSILETPEFRPSAVYGRATGSGSVLFEMADLLHAANVVNPINL